jgi:hypothetical protein
MSADKPIRPAFHHFNLKTTRLQELIDWYTTVVGAEVTFQDATGAWLTNDAANHRIALLCFPGFVDDPDRETRTGMHHSAFEYDSPIATSEAAVNPRASPTVIESIVSTCNDTPTLVRRLRDASRDTCERRVAGLLERSRRLREDRTVG